MTEPAPSPAGDCPLSILILGAHPDDAEFKAGGSAALWRAAGHHVTLASVTDGAAGHHIHPGPDLVARRQRELAAAAALIGATGINLGFPDAHLTANLDARAAVISLIRRCRPDLVLTHRLCDYHPDHRATAQLVQDAAYLVTVPAVCPTVPALAVDPVYAHLSDAFSRPYRFAPTLAVDITPVWETFVSLLACHESQFFEWLPANRRQAPPPDDPAARRTWLADQLRHVVAPWAARCSDLLAAQYGPDHTALMVECFEPSEYGSPLDEPAARRLWPFAWA